jgi:hypothetical protein
LEGVALSGEARPGEVRLTVEGATIVLALTPDGADKAAAMLVRLAAGARRLSVEVTEQK